MAFNPFHGFRKYRKTMFAIITIVCMFVFILSSGLGSKNDFLMSNVLGRGMPAVAEIHGHGIDLEELKSLRNQRWAANECMGKIFGQAALRLDQKVAARAKEFGPMNSPAIERVLEQKRQYAPQYWAIFSSSWAQNIIPVISRLNTDKKTDEAALLERWLRAIKRESEVFRQQLYFGGSTKSNRDLLNFMVWKWVADRNSIKLTRDVVQEMIRREALDEDVDEISKDVLAYMRQNERMSISADALLGYITDEFRVRLAQQAVLGTTEQELILRVYQPMGGMGVTPAEMPSYVTPREFYNYFKDVTTTVRVGLLPVSAEKFLALVTEKPSDADLRALFAKHRRDESNPELERPGFKEGKKVKVEWAELTGDNALIRKAALADADKKSLQADLIKKALMAPPVASYGSVSAWLAQFAMIDDPSLIEKRIDRAYETRLLQKRYDNSSWLYSALSLFTVHEQSVYRPQVIANAVAGMLSATGTSSGFPSLGATICSQAVVEEMRERIRFGMLAFSLAGQNPAALYGVTEMTLPPPLSRAVVYPELREEVVASVVKDYIASEFRQFNEELAKLGKDVKKPETKALLAKHVDDFEKKYGLAHGKSEGFRDRYSLINDPGLAPMKEDYVQNQIKQSATSQGAMSPDLKGERFGNMFFDQPGMASSQGESLYQPGWLGQDPARSSSLKSDEKYFLYWKTDEEPAKERTFEAAKADVEKAWKLNKARELAKKAAEDMQKQIQDKSIRELAALRDFAASQKTDLIEIGPIAKLNESPALQPGQPTEYVQPTIPQDKVSYPTPDFAEKLVDLRDKPVGQTVMLNDAPRKNFYVGVLTERKEPSDFLFELVYARSGYQRYGMAGDTLLTRFETEQALKFYRETMEQLWRDSDLKIINADLMKDTESRNESE